MIQVAIFTQPNIKKEMKNINIINIFKNDFEENFGKLNLIEFIIKNGIKDKIKLNSLKPEKKLNKNNI